MFKFGVVARCQLWPCHMKSQLDWTSKMAFTWRVVDAVYRLEAELGCKLPPVGGLSSMVASQLTSVSTWLSCEGVSQENQAQAAWIR